LLDDTDGDSDKENSRRGANNISVRSNTNVLGAISTRSNIGHVLQELSISGVSERKSLRDRKGGRAGRGSSSIEAANLSLAALSPGPTSHSLPTAGSIERHTEETIAFTPKTSATPTKRLDTEKKQPTPQQDSIRDEIAKSSARIQEVVKVEDSGFVAPLSEQLKSPGDDQNDNESFDPDSPLPISRAPRHSLLLSLTASPTKIGEASPSKSSTGSTSPARDDLLFMPEYHIITTPFRNRPARSSPTASIIKTPTSQAVPRHRDSRSQRREQATLERQVTISNKLSAVSLTMSGLGASAYGSSSTPHKAICAGQKATSTSHSSLEISYPVPLTRDGYTLAGNFAETATKTHSQPTTLVTAYDVFDEPTNSKAPAGAKLPAKHSEPVPASTNIPHNTLETAASRIPKSVAAPTQPVFRKPLISNLPVMKPSLSTIKSSTMSKPTSNFNATLKAVRPEVTGQPELATYATPIRGRAPSTLAYRSPAAFRVVSAGSVVKPIQARTASGTLFPSAFNAARPSTPGKAMHRSIGAGETATATMTPHRSDIPSTMTLLSTSTTVAIVSMSPSHAQSVC
jgi:hypothetical protein